MLDLPDPFGPTKTVTPSSKSNFVEEWARKFPNSTDVIILVSPF
jgi:hypothetical protein